MRPVLRNIIIATILLLAPASLLAQTPEPPSAPTATFSSLVEVRVIDVEVSVTDRSGRPVSNLGIDDFELRLDGEAVPISNFFVDQRAAMETRGTTASNDRASAAETDATVPAVTGDSPSRSHVVILVDHSRLRATNRKRAFTALREAVAQLDDNDLVAVAGIEGGLVFYSDFLFDRQAVSTILDRISKVSRQNDINRIERRQVFGELARGQSGGLLARTTLTDENSIMARIRAYAAEEYDRSLRSLQQIESVSATLAGAPGRKLLLYLGEGIPTRPGEGMYVEWRNRYGGDNPAAGLGQRRYDVNRDYTREIGRFDLTQSMSQLATAVNRAGVTLYAVDAQGNHGNEIRSALTEQGATSETLSVVDENFRAPLEYTTKATGGRLLRSSGNLDDQLVKMFAGLRSFYSLGFVPPAEWEPGSDHEVRVVVNGKGRQVSYPETVRLHAPDEREASATIAALMFQTLDNPLEVGTVAGELTVSEGGESAALPIGLELPIRNLGFVPQDGKQAASISIYVASKDAAGNPGKVQKLPFHMAIPDEFMQEAMGDSARYSLPLVVRPGDRQVAIGVRDNVSGRFSALRLDLATYSTF